MEKIKLYIDEDLSDRVAAALRSKGFDALSAHEVNMRGKTDEEQLRYATKHKRLILTRNIKHKGSELFSRGHDHVLTKDGSWPFVFMRIDVLFRWVSSCGFWFANMNQCRGIKTLKGKIQTCPRVNGERLTGVKALAF